MPRCWQRGMNSFFAKKVNLPGTHISHSKSLAVQKEFQLLYFTVTFILADTPFWAYA